MYLSHPYILRKDAPQKFRPAANPVKEVIMFSITPHPKTYTANHSCRNCLPYAHPFQVHAEKDASEKR